jgi:hypothetical protein
LFRQYCALTHNRRLEGKATNCSSRLIHKNCMVLNQVKSKICCVLTVLKPRTKSTRKLNTDSAPEALTRLVPRHPLPQAGEGSEHNIRGFSSYKLNSLLLMLGEGSGMRVDQPIAAFCVHKKINFPKCNNPKASFEGVTIPSIPRETAKSSGRTP